MNIWISLLLCDIVLGNSVSKTTPLTAAPPELSLDMHGLAEFDRPGERGPKWYDDSEYSKSSSHDLVDSESSQGSSTYSSTSTEEESRSSKETEEDVKKSRLYRKCNPCPVEMLKRHTNLGIKWICGGYQRARRSFKSECMMRYRNCEDGTMFIKLHDLKCINDSYHGRHYFYIYNT